MKAFSTAAIIFTLVASGCASPPITKADKASMAKTVDCSTAAADIKTLTDEKARTSKEIEDGVTSIVPIGAVVHLLMGEEGGSIDIGTGEYDRKLDDKIAQIKKECDIK